MANRLEFGSVAVGAPGSIARANAERIAAGVFSSLTECGESDTAQN
jgi:hypothetical protein